MADLHRLAGVRIRTTLAATLVVALVLAVAGFGFVLLQRAQLEDALTDLADKQATDLARQVSTLGLGSDELSPLVHSEEGVVQVLDAQGRVSASSDPIEESGPIVDSRPDPGETESDNGRRPPGGARRRLRGGLAWGVDAGR